MTTTFEAPPPPEITDVSGVDKGLKNDSIGLFSSIVIAVSSVSPAYSLAATLGFIAAAVAFQSPAIMLVAFIPMFFIAYAYRELNEVDPDCGTTFTWAAKAFGPRTGWMGGWGIIASDVIVMASLAQVAGKYGFLLFDADGVANGTLWVTVVGVAWIALLTYVCYRGLEVSARLQWGLLFVEITTLVVFALVALIKVWSGHGPSTSVQPAWNWLNPFAVHSFSALSSGILLAVFIYWGWDTAVAVNEETEDKEKTPGRAALISTLVLLALYVIVSYASLAWSGTGTLTNNTDDVLAVLGNQVLGTTAGKIMILSVLSSAAACTQTTILPTARTTLAMASYRALPRSFAKIHPRFQTPTTATIGIGLVSAIYFVGLTLISTNVLADSVSSIGLLIAFYYGLSGFACIWFFRRVLLRSPKDLLVKGIMPVLGGLILLAFFVKSAHDMYAADYGETSLWGVGGVFLIGVGSLVLGLILMGVWELAGPAYFRGRTLPPAHRPYIDPRTDQVVLAEILPEDAPPTT